MPSNRSSGQSPEELLERAVAALVREWGVTASDARAAITRCRRQEQRLGPELYRASLDDRIDPPRQRGEDVIDLTHDWTLILDGPRTYITAGLL